ncbi:hypothetical protein RND81_06G128900 [Saponaria officinalis]|uniref:TTF-type domain-containing protein n=1 Tax=Saponaria officinalis TaxID=3572 RepID=A0AAW1KAS1_SAPOF
MKQQLELIQILSLEPQILSLDATNLPQDPGKRKKILDFHPNDQDIVRRVYTTQREFCQPTSHEFPYRFFGDKPRRFNENWLKKYKSWLEYSVEKDAVFCFPCYLFKEKNTPGGDAFVNEGFRTWNKTNAYEKHVGGHNRCHWGCI